MSLVLATSECCLPAASLRRSFNVHRHFLSAVESAASVKWELGVGSNRLITRSDDGDFIPRTAKSEAFVSFNRVGNAPRVVRQNRTPRRWTRGALPTRLNDAASISAARGIDSSEARPVGEFDFRSFEFGEPGAVRPRTFRQ